MDEMKELSINSKINLGMSGVVTPKVLKIDLNENKTTTSSNCLAFTE